MKIVIDISEEVYKEICDKNYYSLKGKEALRIGVINGTVLPKGHGRLIILSEDAVKREQTPLSFSCQNWISEVCLSNATVAIIEADKS